MEPKSPNYEKLTDEKPPVSPVLRPFRLRFRKMLSSGSLKISSTPASPAEKEEFTFSSNSAESLVRPGSSGFSSRPSSFSSSERSPLAKEAPLDDKLRLTKNWSLSINPAVGMNKFGNLPKLIAHVLVDAGDDLLSLKRHGGWRSDKVAESYIDNSLNNKTIRINF